MIEKFSAYIKENKFFSSSEKTLLAVSGGMDSVVMFYLFLKCRIPFSVAHCNFNLRGEESDDDEIFVINLARKNKIKFHVKSFDTVGFARKNKISVEMAARELRFAWFDELCHTHGYDKTALAHHQNDNAETIMLNIIRGTGIKGLTGIKPKRDRYIRPLLFATRDEIRDYASSNSISYCNDSTNTESEYYRNKLRNVIFPEIEKINPSFIQTVNKESSYWKEIFLLYSGEYDAFKAEYVTKNAGGVTSLSKKGLLRSKASHSFLFEFVSGYGFNSGQSWQIFESIHSSGKIFSSEQYELVIDREYIFVKKKNGENFITTYLNENGNPEGSPYILSETIKRTEISDVKNPDHAYLNKSKLKFPLILRKWQEGDWFIPFGMRGKKKISDFLVDNKVNRFDKRTILVVESDGDIVWLVGQRIDDRYKINKNTSEIFHLFLNTDGK